MKKPISRRRLILIFLVVFLILGVAVLLRDFVRQAILQPLIDLGWFVWVEMQTVPQLVYWALFVLVALLIALRSLRGSSGGGFTGYGTRGGPRATQTSRYHHWKVSLDALSGSPFAQERMERELQNLVMQILADQARVDFEEMRERQNRGLLDLSAEPAVIGALFARDPRHRFFLAQQPSALSAWLARLLRRVPASVQSGAPAFDVNGIVTWLEEQTGQRDRYSPEGSGNKDFPVNISS